MYEIATLPLSAPDAAGANVTVPVTLCPAASVRVLLTPLRENPVPDALACVIVTLELPEFVSKSDCFWLPPTETLPKLIEDGLAVSCPLLASALNGKHRQTRSKQNP